MKVKFALVKGNSTLAASPFYVGCRRLRPLSFVLRPRYLLLANGASTGSPTRRWGVGECCEFRDKQLPERSMGFTMNHRR